MTELATFDLVVHGLLVAVDVAVVAAVRARPGRAVPICAVGALGALVLAVGVARLLTPDRFAVMRALAWVLLVHGPVDLLVAAGLSRRAARADAAVLAVCGAACGLVGIDGLLVEPRWLDVEELRIEADVDAPLRIVVLADLQSDDFGAWERRAVDRAMEARPDLVLLAGDYVQIQLRGEDYGAQVARFRELVAGLRAPLGVHAVRGNAEWRETWADDLFRGLDHVTAYEDTASVDLGPLVLTGLSFEDGFDPAHRVAPAEGFHVVLAHAPDFSLGDARADLLVAGHTHGGQVNVPLLGPPITYSQVPRDHAAGGLHALASGARLLVARGIGMERGFAPRLRVNCRPHLVIVDVVPRGGP